MSFAAKLLQIPILAYRWILSPMLGPRCRYLPSCSDYALDALRHHGALNGVLLILRRLARCHPWGGSGYDPVPPAVRRPCHYFAPNGMHTAPNVTVPGTPEEP
ncbi:MAG: membrane protein insertion efficiency factor YidD [Rhodospirillaceae bacterium]